MTRLNTRLFPLFLASLVSIATAAAGEKQHEQLTIGPASSYEFKQTSENVTIAADVYEVGDKVRQAFGKHNPYDYGVLPILVVIDNHTAKAIRVGDMKVVYQVHGGDKIEATPPGELKYLLGARRPNPGGPRLPIPGIPGGSGKPKANPLSEWEIEGRAFAARVIPPNESASGFFYFQTGHRSNSTLYLSGLTEAGSGRELLYFEIPLAPVQHSQWHPSPFPRDPLTARTFLSRGFAFALLLPEFPAEANCVFASDLLQEVSDTVLNER